MQYRKVKPIFKKHLSPDCPLQLEGMKSESLVIVDQHATVNTFSGLVHTAHQVMEIDFTRRWYLNRKEGANHGKISNWD